MRRRWIATGHALPQPCSRSGSQPDCPEDELDGTLVHDGIYRCGIGVPTLRQRPFGVASERLGLYSVELDESVGLTYRIVLSAGALSDEKALELIVRTPKAGDEELFPVVSLLLSTLYYCV